MKRLIAVALVLLAVVVAEPAVGTVPTDNRVSRLEGQVTVLRRELKSLKLVVKELRSQVKVLRETLDQTRGELQGAIEHEKNRDLCVALVLTDLFQSTWSNVDQRIGWAPFFGPQEPAWDPSCPLFGVTRPGITSHPTVDIFGALTAAFIG